MHHAVRWKEHKLVSPARTSSLNETLLPTSGSSLVFVARGWETISRVCVLASHDGPDDDHAGAEILFASVFTLKRPPIKKWTAG